MFASMPSSQSLWLPSSNLPEGGPELLLTKISGASHAASNLERPSSIFKSPTIGTTETDVREAISSADFSQASPGHAHW